MSFEDLLNGICKIQERQETQSDAGEIKIDWVDIASEVECRKVIRRSPALDTKLGRVTVIDHIFYFMPDIIVKEGNRIIFENEAFLVTSVGGDSEKHHKSVVTEKTIFE